MTSYFPFPSSAVAVPSSFLSNATARKAVVGKRVDKRLALIFVSKVLYNVWHAVFKEESFKFVLYIAVKYRGCAQPTFSENWINIDTSACPVKICRIPKYEKR